MSAGCSRGRIKLRFPGFANFPTLSHLEKKASVFMTGSFFFDMDFHACSPIPNSEFRIKKSPPPPPQKGAATAKKIILFPNENAPRCAANFSFWLTGTKCSVAALR